MAAQTDWDMIDSDGFYAPLYYRADSCHDVPHADAFPIRIRIFRLVAGYARRRVIFSESHELFNLFAAGQSGATSQNKFSEKAEMTGSLITLVALIKCLMAGFA